MLEDPKRRAADAWTQIALGEHASIPSFARFIMELVAVGAPPDLLERAAAAISDEVRHAKLAFAMAGRLLGRSVGPSSLDISNAVTRQPEIEDICVATFVEGCVEEGIAAEQARIAAEESSGPAKAVWQTVAKDEHSHAELAWSAVEWLLSQQPDVAEILNARLEEVESSLGSFTVDEDREGLLDYGILSRTRQAEIAVEVFEAKILPRARALIDSRLPVTAS